MACDGPMDAMGWGGGGGGNGRYAGWGRNVPTLQLHKQRNRLWAGRSRVMGRWGVAAVMDALAILLYRTHSFPLACLTSSLDCLRIVEQPIVVAVCNVPKWNPPLNGSPKNPRAADCCCSLQRSEMEPSSFRIA
jgi:hypothetical protein